MYRVRVGALGGVRAMRRSREVDIPARKAVSISRMPRKQLLVAASGFVCLTLVWIILLAAVLESHDATEGERLELPSRTHRGVSFGYLVGPRPRWTGQDMAANEPEFVPQLLSILSPPLPQSPLLRSEADSEAHWGILDNAVCFDEGGEACATWAKEGECRRNAAFMLAACQRSCCMCNLTKLLRTLDARAAADGTLDPLERQPVAEHCQRRRGVCGELRSQASCFRIC